MSDCSIDFWAELKACPTGPCACTASGGCRYKHPQNYDNTNGDSADPVNNPSHYASGAIECIDAIQASMPLVEFQGYLKGNVLKYTWRYRNKGGEESLRKAEWYLKRLLSTFP